MAKDSEFMLVFSTAPSKKVGRDIAREVVSLRLAACVHVVAGMTSVYEWEGKMQESEEVMIMAKTSRSKVKELIKEIVSRHPYDVPEVVAVPIETGHQEYLEWMNSIVGSSGKTEDMRK